MSSRKGKTTELKKKKEIDEFSDSDESTQSDEDIDQEDDDVIEDIKTDEDINDDDIEVFTEEEELLEVSEEEKEIKIEEIPTNECDDIEIFDENEVLSDEKEIKGDDRVSMNILSKYERTRLLGVRARLLMEGAKPLIKNYESLSFEEIAELELKNKVIPLKIKKPFPNGYFEIWRVSELEILD